MKRTIGALTVAMGLALGTSAFAAGNAQTEKVKLEQLPQNIQTTINQHLEGGKVKKVERVTENGQTYYEVSFKNSAGDKQEFRVDSNGQYQASPQSEKQGMDRTSPSQNSQTSPMGGTRGQTEQPQR